MPLSYSFSNDKCLTGSNRSERNSFVIEDYDKAKTFSSFLPGIAGVDGIPMWSFYVNRGQAMGSFGTRDKDGVIMEFFPANIMYRNIEHQGFRTFIRKDGKIHEIFSSVSEDDIGRRLSIEKNLISIEEENHTLGLRINVTYFTMPGESFAALVRKVTIERLEGSANGNGSGGSNADFCEIELLDGLPQILPYGVGNTRYQATSNLSKSWFGVYNLENDIAYYKVRGDLTDTAEVRECNTGNFYLAFSSESGGLIPPIFDMNVIFGENTALTRPDGWDTGAGQLHKKRQIYENKVSGGFAGIKTVFPGDEQNDKRFILCTMIGCVSGPELINCRKKDFTVEYIDKKQEEARRLVENLMEDVFTKTADPMFDQYIEQCYLDNFLRGGYPLIFRTDESEESKRNKNVVYHVFSRKHGDIEREYNFFSLEPTCYSQGNGNFRDVNQNRRNDVLIKPEVMDFNVKQLMSLIQADGYNPLVVKGCTFTLNQGDRDELMKMVISKREEVNRLLSAKFTPGELITCIRERKAELATDEKDFLGRVLAASNQEFAAEFSEGYWSDHWTYNLDLVETFLAIYPDKKQELLFEDNTYRFFYSPVFVLPREDKYVLVNGKVRQYGALLHITVAGGEKHGAGGGKPGARTGKPGLEVKSGCWLKTDHGSGSIYETNLFAKLVSLALNKFISLDPFGMGIEMEADKPGWNDAMNGLPGLFGSGLSETAELKRVVDFLIECCMQYDCKIAIYEEAADLMREVEQLLDRNLTGETGDFIYWDSVSVLKEKYRRAVCMGIDGKEVYINTKELLGTFKKFAEKLKIGLEKALSMGNGIYPTYFTYEALEYKVIEGKISPINGYPNVEIIKFGCKPLPLFLEAPARMLKTMQHTGKAAGSGIAMDSDCADGRHNGESKSASGTDAAKVLYDFVKASEIYDRKLKMYKTSAPMENTSFEVGRLLAFTPGWLEREAIFLHMEYKYLYAMLKAGLYEEFYEDIKTMLVPYMRPEIYGRSILENSSFIASSVNPDESLHGRGYVGRMSGTTAEMLSIWFMMMTGTKLFEVKDGKLILSLEPILSGEMFDRKGTVSFKFLGKVTVTYYNPRRVATFGEHGARPHRYVLTTDQNETVQIVGSSIRSPYAQMVRSGMIEKIEVHLSPEIPTT
jgi:hypothetical protein